MVSASRAWAAACLIGAMTMAAGCAATPIEPPGGAGEPQESPTPAADFATTFDIGGGRMLYMECQGAGSPTVVLVSGQRAAADDWMIVADGIASPPVFDLISEETRVCAFDRPGTVVGGENPSRSDPIDQPTDSQGMVDDLHALLIAADVTGPIVIVGHSAGGLATRLFASTHPDEVAGMVLVDALSEGLQDHLTAEQWVIQKPLLRGDIDASIAEYPALEWLDPDASFAQVRAAPALRQMPLIVIASDELIGPTIPGLKASGAIGQEIPDDFGYITDIAQQKSQAAQAALLAGSVFITKTDSGHNVHIEQPALVAGAIVDVVERVREGADTAVD